MKAAENMVKVELRELVKASDYYGAAIIKEYHYNS